MHESMMAPLASESLDLDPANPSSLDIITATRAGTATYTDASGNIQTASPNTVRVDHVQGEELTPTKFQRVGYTDFSSGWGVHNGATVSGTGSYNGSVTKEITAVGYSTYHTSIATTPNSSYTLSFYARLISGSNSSIYIYRQHTETAFTNISLTSEWQRFDVAVTASGSSVNFGIAKTSGATDPVVFEISQPQFEEGTTASDFVANTTGSPKYFAAATYGPRVPMILVEPAATNELTYNSTFESDWTFRDSAVEQSTVAAPDGSNAYRAYRSTAGNAAVTQLINVPCSNHTYTYSGYFKSDGTHNKARLYIYAEGGAGAATTSGISLEDGSISYIYPPDADFTASDFKTEEVGDGWWRIIATFTIQSATATGLNIRFYPAESSSSPVGWGQYVWGLQVERGTVATSFIPTSGSAVTRAADDLVIDGSDFTDFFNTSEGTFYIEMELHKDSDGTQNWILGGGDATTRFLYQHSYSNELLSYDGANLLFLSPHPTNQIFRAAMTYNATTQSSVLDGGNIDTDTHNGNYSTADQLRLGGRSSTGYHINGHIKRVIYWPHHSDNL
jgi:hypothetical protein